VLRSTASSPKLWFGTPPRPPTLCSLTRAVPCQVCEQVHAYGLTPYHQQMGSGHTDEGVPYHYFTGHADEEQVWIFALLYAPWDSPTVLSRPVP
jgi:hypothetical protein